MYEPYADRVIVDFAELGRMFTAYDVSREVQSLMDEDGLPFVRHNDMKNYIHSACETLLPNDWGRTPISIPNIPTRPFLYHRHQDDPNSYGSPQSIPTISSVAPTIPAPASNPRPSGVKKPSGWPKIEVAPHDGRLNLPKFLLASLGAWPHDSIYVRIDPSNRKMILTMGDEPGSKKFNVAASGRVRITRNWRESNNFPGSSFVLSIEGDRGIIEPVTGNT